MKTLLIYIAIVIGSIVFGFIVTDRQIVDNLDQEIDTYGGGFYTLTTKYGNDVIIRDGGTIYHIDSIKCIRA